MAYDEALATQIRTALARRKNTEEKKMVGGICFRCTRCRRCSWTSGARAMCSTWPGVAKLERRRVSASKSTSCSSWGTESVAAARLIGHSPTKPPRRAGGLPKYPCAEERP